jgi:hypothetical protein
VTQEAPGCRRSLQNHEDTSGRLMIEVGRKPTHDRLTLAQSPIDSNSNTKTKEHTPSLNRS